MRIGILGTGVVGATIGTKLISLGHQVMMGSREKGNTKATDWVKANGAKASNGTFAESASFGELLFNCTSGMNSLSALVLAGAENMKDKVLIDVANPLDFSQGMPPILNPCNDNSLGEEIQKAYPETMVVKTLNTMNCQIMINPAMIKGDHCVFMSGNSNGAKNKVKSILESFGWKNIIDLGDIGTSRGSEQLLPIWIRLWGVLGTANFNFGIVQ